MGRVNIMTCRLLTPRGNDAFVNSILLVVTMIICGCGRLENACDDDTGRKPVLSELPRDTGISIPVGSVLLQSEREDAVVDAKSYFKILMTSKDAECLRGVLRAYSTQNVQMRISLRDESDWWKHDSHAERYVVDMPNGNSVCVVYDFVDCSTNTILYVAVIPF